MSNDPDPKSTRCTVCAEEFSDAEIATATCCPNCGSKGVPCAIDQDTEIEINWHELRLVCIWASNWAQEKLDPEKDSDSIQALNSIIRRLEAQRKEGWAALTLFGEIKELPEVLENLGIDCDGVELHQGGKQVYPPKPTFKVVESDDE